MVDLQSGKSGDGNWNTGYAEAVRRRKWGEVWNAEIKTGRSAPKLICKVEDGEDLKTGRFLINAGDVARFRLPGSPEDLQQHNKILHHKL